MEKKTKEQILEDCITEDKSKFLLEWSELSKSNNGISYRLINERVVLSGMSEYAKPLEERILELESKMYDWLNQGSTPDFIRDEIKQLLPQQ